ncbi:MAG: AAA-associated domain-containing protein [Thermoplasmata archaeon]
MGLLVLLQEHKGSDDVALLADDLELELDEILPALEFAEALGLLKVSDGRATLTDTGRQLLAGSISERKALIRDLLTRTTLFRTLLRALQSAPDHCLPEEEYTQLLELTSAPSEEMVQTIVNWGRYAGLFRYDSDRRALVAIERSTPVASVRERNRPPIPPAPTTAGGADSARTVAPSVDPVARSAPWPAGAALSPENT